MALNYKNEYTKRIMESEFVMYVVDNTGYCVYFMDGVPVSNPTMIDALEHLENAQWNKHYICIGDLHYCGVLSR